MDADGLRQEISTTMRRVIAEVVLHNHAVAQRVGLAASDAQFVSLLAQHGSLTPGRLAGLTGLTTGTVTGVVDRLERGGYVRRQPVPGDRRKVLVTLIPAAMAGLAEHYRDQGRHLDEVLAGRTPEELRVIALFLADLLA